MAGVALVTDSSACLPAPVVAALAIRILPITVHLPGLSRSDGTEGLPAQVYQALEADQPVKSSPPSVADYLGAIDEADAEAVVVVVPASEFTDMRSHALLACELSGGRAVTVDSRTAAAGQALVVLAGAEAASSGAPLERVLRAIEEASSRVDLVASLDELGPLRRSGRVPSPSLGPARLVDARTVFRMRRGAVEPLARVGSPGAALRRIHQEWEGGGGPGATSCAVFHADCPELASQLGERLSGVTMVAGFSAAMGINTGRGVVGAAWLSSADGPVTEEGRSVWAP